MERLRSSAPTTPCSARRPARTSASTRPASRRLGCGSSTRSTAPASSARAGTTGRCTWRSCDDGRPTAGAVALPALDITLSTDDPPTVPPRPRSPAGHREPIAPAGRGVGHRRAPGRRGGRDGLGRRQGHGRRAGRSPTSTRTRADSTSGTRAPRSPWRPPPGCTAHGSTARRWSTTAPTRTSRPPDLPPRARPGRGRRRPRPPAPRCPQLTESMSDAQTADPLQVEADAVHLLVARSVGGRSRPADVGPRPPGAPSDRPASGSRP